MMQAVLITIGVMAFVVAVGWRQLVKYEDAYPIEDDFMDRITRR